MASVPPPLAMELNVHFSCQVRSYRVTAARCSPNGCPAQPSCNTTSQCLAESAMLSAALTRRLHCCRLEQFALHACVPQQLRPLTMSFFAQAWLLAFDLLHS